MNYNNLIGYFFLLFAGISYDYSTVSNKEEQKQMKEELSMARKEAILIRQEVALVREEAIRMKEEAALEKQAADRAGEQTVQLKEQIKDR